MLALHNQNVVLGRSVIRENALGPLDSDFGAMAVGRNFDNVSPFLRRDRPYRMPLVSRKKGSDRLHPPKLKESVIATIWVRNREKSLKYSK
jgi:hypothetical protein